MTQGVLPFQYEVSTAACGMTALAGLPAYLDLAMVSGLTGAIRRYLKAGAKRQQGWTDEQVVMSLVLLNLAGGDGVDDLRVLQGDEGFARVLRHVELHGRPRKERRALESGAGAKRGAERCLRLRRCFAISRRFMIARKRPSA